MLWKSQISVEKETILGSDFKKNKIRQQNKCNMFMCM